MSEAEFIMSEAIILGAGIFVLIGIFGFIGVISFAYILYMVTLMTIHKLTFLIYPNSKISNWVREHTDSYLYKALGINDDDDD